MPSNGNAAAKASERRDAHSAYGRSTPSERARKDDGSQLAVIDPIASLDDVLSAIPVDLCRIADVMKESPEFQTMVMRLASSLLVSPEDSATTIEQAVVALGTERLRALLHIWSRFRDRRLSDGGAPEGATRMSRTARESVGHPRELFPTNAESLYLATFLRDLAADASAPSIASVAAQLLASSSETIEFRDLSILLRDSVASTAQLDRTVRERERVDSGVINSSARKEYE